jgi:heat shock protein HslJ
MNVDCTMSPARALLLVVTLCAGATGVDSATAASGSTPSTPPADRAVARTLEAHRWTLRSAADRAGRPLDALLPAGHPFVMSFNGPRVSVVGGCNQQNGAWRLGPQRQLTVGRLASTMKACEQSLMEADKALAAVLAQPTQVELTPGATPELTLTTATRQTLTFSGQPTLRSLYGAPKRIFLEVAGQTIDCTLPSGAVGSCLQVRDVHFDGQGLRKGPPGPWRAFAEPIEGYAHTPGVRNVLRIDRYEREPAPAGAAAVRYVLDLVIESETVAGK